MSESTRFFAAPGVEPVAFRQSLERAGLQAILDVPDEVRRASPPGRTWVSFASPSGNREHLLRVSERLLEIAEYSGGWSLAFFWGREETVLGPEQVQVAKGSAGMDVRRREWLQRFLMQDVAPLLSTLVLGGPSAFCRAVGIHFLELADQDTVPWAQLEGRFAGRRVLTADELSD